MLSILTTILLFIVVIGVVITIHEFGHFLASKLSGIKVEEFCFGFGPRILHKKVGDTDYGIRLFPIGGYVKILGEEEKVKSKHSFSAAPMRNRVFVLIAGIIMNLILAVALFYVVLGLKGFEYSAIPYYENFKFVFGTQSVDYAYPPTALEVTADTPAAEAGLVAPFEVVRVNETEVNNYDEVKAAVAAVAGENVVLGICDLGSVNCREVGVTVAADGTVGLGFAADVEVWKVSYSGVERVFSGFLHMVNMLKAYFFILGQLISTSVQQGSIEPIASTMTGPVGIYAIVDIVKQFGGVVGMIDLVAMLSLTLAVSNIFPFPALDGGQLLFLLIEIIKGKPVNDNVKKWVFAIGMILIFVLAAAIAVKDFIQFGGWDWVKGLFS